MLPFIPSGDFDDNDDEEEDRDDGFSISDSPPLEARGGSSVEHPLLFRLKCLVVLATRIRTYRPAKAVDAPNTTVAVFLEIISKKSTEEEGYHLVLLSFSDSARSLISSQYYSRTKKLNLPIHTTLHAQPLLLQSQHNGPEKFTVLV
mmetsp:Transcript_4187/g.10395  ORF Transcript_4187/g.10395 Transcript_4187/m.10395 type:complete len:147 (-) Transcript_4187:100-540(-)